MGQPDTQTGIAPPLTNGIAGMESGEFNNNEINRERQSSETDDNAVNSIEKPLAQTNETFVIFQTIFCVKSRLPGVRIHKCVYSHGKRQTPKHH